MLGRLVIASGSESHIGHRQALCARRRSGRLAARGRRLRRRRIVMGLPRRSSVSIVSDLRLGHVCMVMVVAIETGSQSHCHRCGHDGVGAHQYQRTPKARDLLCPTLPDPGPPCAHDDIALQKKHADASGPNSFRLTGGRSDGRSRDAGHDPQPRCPGVGRNPGCEYQSHRPRPGDEGPEQLEDGQCGEEHSRRPPIAPVHGCDAEVDDRRTDRSDRRTAGREPAIDLVLLGGRHRSTMTRGADRDEQQVITIGCRIRNRELRPTTLNRHGRLTPLGACRGPIRAATRL